MLDPKLRCESNAETLDIVLDLTYKTCITSTAIVYHILGLGIS